MRALIQRWEAFRARRAERRAMLLFGETLPGSEEVQAADAKLAALERTLSLSLQRDRADWAAVAKWARPLVVLRGLLDRAVLLALLRSARRDRAAACLRLAENSPDSAAGAAAESARQARKAAEIAAAQVQPLPWLLRELLHFARFLSTEARSQLVPRAPALIGLLVGFWIAQTFTDNGFSATLHSWGIGVGPRRAVRSETLRAMSFWLPLLAAALSSYAGSRLAALVRSRYAPDR